MRTIGLAWRKTSSRKDDFAALGQIVRGLQPGVDGRRRAPAAMETRDAKA
jgi:LysR family hydrogen peroxide-inducible transcriptional activator